MPSGTAAGCRQISNDRTGDSTGRTGDQKDCVAIQVELQYAIVNRVLNQGNRIPLVLPVTHLNDTGINDCFGDQGVSRSSSLPAGGKVNYFHQHVRPLPFEGFGKASNSTAQGCCRPGRAITV